MPSVKLSVTVRKNLARKYDAGALARIDAAVKRWIDADRKRGIRTVHLALDDARSMTAHRVKAVTGRATARKVKQAIDALWKRLAPDYLVLFGADDVVPYFVVDNPSYGGRDGDGDVKVRTDNPYACAQRFSAAKRSTYLLPDRAVGRIPDAPTDGDPAWLVDHLATAESWAPQPRSAFDHAYAICCDSWRRSGEACVEYVGEDASRLMIAPPEGDATKLPASRLGSRLHLIKCHGAQIDPNFYGQKGSSYPVALSSRSARKKIRANTVAGAMCCYGAQVFSPDDPAVSPAGAWPIASAYLRRGALGFAGATEIAWVGDRHMACADWIVSRHLRSILDGASQGRALLEAKQDYLRSIQQRGQAPGIEDEKTLLEFVLLGDPSIQPVNGVPALPAGGGRAGGAPRAVAASALAAKPSDSVLAERRQRRLFRAQLATQIRESLPERSEAKGMQRTRAGSLLQVVRKLMTNGGKAFRFSRTKVNVFRVQSTFSRAQAEAAGFVAAPRAKARGGARPAAAPASRESYQYYWSGKRVTDGHEQIRLVRVETDPKGQVLRTSVVVSG
jgi:hypothetical protein